MSTVEIQEGSIEYLFWPIQITDDTGALVNPTGDAVELAFRPVRATTLLTFYPAAWETDVGVPNTYFARALIGAGNFVLAAGVWEPYIRITDAPEIPLLGPGELGYVYVAAR